MALTKVTTDMIEPLTKADVGLASVDNTSDADKPVSTATAAALADKANTVDLASKADVAHTHTVSNITDLNTASFCKAWVNFDGAAVGPSITPRAGHNIASVTKTATGQYTVAFATPMADANYVVTNTMGDTTGQWDGDWDLAVTAVAAGSFDVAIYDHGVGVYRDQNLIMLAVFGN